eukprot:1157460-Pelagomonas_calceolata.AAC.1
MSELRTRRCAQEHPACTEGLLSDVRNASQGKCAAWIAARVFVNRGKCEPPPIKMPALLSILHVPWLAFPSELTSRL